ERRKELAKHVSHEGESAKVAIRSSRRDAMQHVKDLLRDKKITEDEERRAEDEVQKLTDKFIKDVDVVVKGKDDELLALSWRVSPPRHERPSRPSPAPPHRYRDGRQRPLGAAAR